MEIKLLGNVGVITENKLQLRSEFVTYQDGSGDLGLLADGCLLWT